MKYRGTTVGTVSDLLNLWNCRKDFHNAWRAIVPRAMARNHKLPIGSLGVIRDEILAIPVLKTSKYKNLAGKALHNPTTKERCIVIHAGCFDKNDILWHDRHDTFFHELAHHVRDILFKKGKDPHDPEWQFCMASFGYIPYVTAHMEYNGYKERHLAPLADAAKLFENF